MENEFQYDLLKQMDKAEADQCMKAAYSSLLTAREYFKTSKYDFAKIYYKRAAILYNELYFATMNSDFRKEIAETTSKLAEEAGYHLGLCCYDDFEFDDAIYVLDYKCMDSTRSAALLALCYRKQNSVPIPQRKYSLAYEYIKQVLKDKQYATAPKSEYEEKIYIEIIILVSEIYKIGSTFESHLFGKYDAPYRGIVPNPERAVALLNETLASVAYESNRTCLLTALNQYKTETKGFLGFIKKLFI